MKPPLPSSDVGPDFVSKSVDSGGAQPSAKAIYEQRKNYVKNASAMGEISEYRVEHLATFAIERKGAMLTVDDSIRKLKLLDARGKVWTQEVYLYVDDKCVKLLDMDTHDELEHFPLSTLQHIQPVIGACQFDNICALILKDPEQKTPDIHLFQCTNAPADQVCADINSAWQDTKSKKGKKSRPDTLRKQRESVRAMMNGNNPPNSQINVKEKVAAWTTTIEQQTEPFPASPRSANSLQDDSPEMQAFKVQRDVQMLNHALDDIEIFVQRMQKSAEAAKELTTRKSKKRSSKRSKDRERGIAMLELRARLPPPEMFNDCYQKFKFCFNLLAKLKTHIQNPNAVELVHFLFQPLTMIVSTSGKELPQGVQCPLLNKETIEFLHNCLTSIEHQLLKDLGDFWNKCKADFPRDVYFPPYVPQFTSGWEPPPLPFLETEASELAAAIAGQADQVQKAQQAWVAGGSRIEDSLQTKPLSPPIGESNLSRKTSMTSPNGKEATSAFKHHVQNHVARNQAMQQASSSNGLPSNRKLARAMETYRSRNDKELSVNLDDLLTVLDDSRDWWFVQDAEGQSGFVPGTIMLLLSSASSSKTPPASIPPAPQSPVSSSSGSNIASAASVPPPPPPPPAMVPPPPPPSSQAPPAPKIVPIPLSSVQLKKPAPREEKSIPKSGDSSRNLQEELKQRVSSQKQKPNFVIPKKHASSAALRVTMESDSHDVKHWLHSLGFSFLTCESLGILNGEQLFSLTKDDLKQVCEDEASRVYSQIEVQRSMMVGSGAKESELQKKLRERRENADD